MPPRAGPDPIALDFVRPYGARSRGRDALAVVPWSPRSWRVALRFTRPSSLSVVARGDGTVTSFSMYAAGSVDGPGVQRAFVVEWVPEHVVSLVPITTLDSRVGGIRRSWTGSRRRR